MKFRKPSSGTHYLPKSEHVDHLLLFVGDSSIVDVTTSRGSTKAAHVDIVACTDCLEAWIDQLVFGKVLVIRLTGGSDDGPIVGRLGQGLPKPGQSPAWTLSDPTDDDIAKAEWFAVAYLVELPSGAIGVDLDVLAHDRALK